MEISEQAQVELKKALEDSNKGCISGALPIELYLEAIKDSGFANILVHKQRKIEIPENILRNYLNDDEIKNIINGDIGIFSITVSGTKTS